MEIKSNAWKGKIRTNKRMSKFLEERAAQQKAFVEQVKKKKAQIPPSHSLSAKTTPHAGGGLGIITKKHHSLFRELRLAMLTRSMTPGSC